MMVRHESGCAVVSDITVADVVLPHYGIASDVGEITIAPNSMRRNVNGGKIEMTVYQERLPEKSSCVRRGLFAVSCGVHSTLN